MASSSNHTNELTGREHEQSPCEEEANGDHGVGRASEMADPGVAPVREARLRDAAVVNLLHVALFVQTEKVTEG